MAFSANLLRHLDHLQQYRFAGIDQLIQRDAVGRAFALRRAVAGDQRHMDEGCKRRALVPLRRLDRAPAQIVAEIASGITRGAGIDAGALSRAQKLCGMRAEHPRVGAAGDRSLSRAVAVGVGKPRGDGVAGTGFDPDMCRTVGEAKHQDCMRAMSGDEFGKLPIDGRVGDVENVADQFDIAERGAAQPQQPRHQRRRRIERRAGKRAETGDKEAEVMVVLPFRHGRA
jgi:hypothetical protein